jgi:hypothetical protein
MGVFREMTQNGKLKDHQNAIDVIVNQAKYPAQDTAKMLEANVMLFKDELGVANLYKKAAASQWIYHVMFDQKGLKSSEKEQRLAKFTADEIYNALLYSPVGQWKKIDAFTQLSKFRNDLKSHIGAFASAVIVWDKEADVRTKISRLEYWNQFHPSVDLDKAIKGQRYFLSKPKSAPPKVMPTLTVLNDASIIAALSNATDFKPLVEKFGLANYTPEAIFKALMGSPVSQWKKIYSYTQLSKLLPDLAPRNGEFASAVIVWDNTVMPLTKIDRLEYWNALYPSRELKQAIAGQKDFIQELKRKQAKNPTQPKNNERVAKTDSALVAISAAQDYEPLMAKYGVTIETVLKDVDAAGYIKFGYLNTDQARRVLKEVWNDLGAQALFNWSEKDKSFQFAGQKMAGPAEKVDFNELVGKLALSYLETYVRYGAGGEVPRETQLRIAHIFQSHMGIESRFDPTAYGTTNGIPNGVGLLQHTPISIYQMNVNSFGKINDKVESWGGMPFKENRSWLVQKKGKSIARGPQFRSVLEEAAINIVETSKAFIHLGLDPSLKGFTTGKTPRNYNGNKRVVKTREGKKMQVRDDYAKEVQARVKLADALADASEKRRRN